MLIDVNIQWYSWYYCNFVVSACVCSYSSWISLSSSSPFGHSVFTKSCNVFVFYTNIFWDYPNDTVVNLRILRGKCVCVSIIGCGEFSSPACHNGYDCRYGWPYANERVANRSELVDSSFCIHCVGYCVATPGMDKTLLLRNKYTTTSCGLEIQKDSIDILRSRLLLYKDSNEKAINTWDYSEGILTETANCFSRSFKIL